MSESNSENRNSDDGQVEQQESVNSIEFLEPENQQTISPEQLEQQRRDSEVADRLEESQLKENLDDLYENKDDAVEQELTAEQKQEKWDETIEGLDNISDGLGKPIDGGIKETVASFMVNGFSTQGSCEGHVEKRFGKRIKISPYVDIGMPEPETRFIGESEIRNQIANEHGVDPRDIERNKDARNAFDEYIDTNKPQETAEYMAARAKNQEMELSARTLLETFYGETPEENRAIRIPRPFTSDGNFRITTAPKKAVGEIGFFQAFGERKKLKQEQSQMSSFGNFLKEKYFGK